MAQNILIYRNLKQISAILFHEIKFSGNLLLLDKDYSEDKEYEPSEIIEINNTWLKMYDEYFEKTDDTRLKKTLKNKNKTLELSLKIVNIQKIIQILEDFEENKRLLTKETQKEVLMSLSGSLMRIERRIKLNITKPIKEQLKNLNSVLGGLQSRYKILFKEDVQVTERDIMLFYDLKASIEQVLERNLDDTVNMLQWISYTKLYNKKIENRKRLSKVS